MHANDQWLVAISGRITVVDPRMTNNFNFIVNVSRVLSTSTSLMWSITYNNSMTQNVSKHEIISCTTIYRELIYVVKVTNVDRNTTSLYIWISGLVPDSMYNCCATAHILINLTIEVINSACTTYGKNSCLSLKHKL